MEDWSVWDKWSVSAAFSRFGIYRYVKYERYAKQIYGWYPEDHARSGPSAGTTRRRTEEVADCIRGLGYRVECGSIMATNNCGGHYFIMNIIDSSGVYIYGQKSDCEKRGGEMSLRDVLDSRVLAGHRTISQKDWESCKQAREITGRGYMLEVRRPDDGVWRLDTNQIYALSRKGAYSNREMRAYESAVSTIGNTLPGDIVEALEKFRPRVPDETFYQEHDYEFWIPESMRIDTACPCAEEVLGGQAEEGGSAAALAPAAVAPVAPPLSKGQTDESDSSDSSDSSDDDDDEREGEKKKDDERDGSDSSDDDDDKREGEKEDDESDSSDSSDDDDDEREGEKEDDEREYRENEEYELDLARRYPLMTAEGWCY